MKKTIMFFILSLTFCGCKFLEIAPLTIERVSPDSAIVDTSTIAKIDVYFSADADKSLCEQAFSILEDGIAMEGRFAWPESDHLEFYPLDAFERTPHYTIRITQAAEDTNGNSLDEEFVREFRASEDTLRPTVSSVTPQDNARPGTKRPVIEVVFSEPMDVSSVIGGFSLSPGADGYIVESADNTSFRYQLTEDLAWQKPYTISVSDSVRDAAGNTLAKSQTHTFFMGSESVKPTILTVAVEGTQIALTSDSLTDSVETVTSNLEKDARISISFSEPMERDTAKNAISFAPAVNHEATWNSAGDVLTITATDAFDRDTVYVLTIAKECPDLQGNELASSALYKFRANGPRSAPPRITAVTFLNSFTGAVATGTETLDHMRSIVLANRYETGTITGFFDIYLTVTEGATIDPLDFIDAFSIASSNVSITPIACEIDGGITFLKTEVPPQPAGGNVHVVRYIADINNSGAYTDVPGYIRLTIDPEFSDSLDNAIGDGWQIRVNTAN